MVNGGEILFGRKLKLSIYKQGLTSQELQEALTSSGDNQPTSDAQLNTDPTNTSTTNTTGGSGILRFEIDENLPVDFEISRTLDNSGKSDSASLRIYGISEETAKIMGHQMLTCKIEVGYETIPLTAIFMGDVVSASYKKGNGQESDYADFELSHSYLKQNLSSKISTTFPRGTPVWKVIGAVSEYFEMGNKLLNIDADTDELMKKTLPYGMSIDGTLNECLQKLLKPFNMRWNMGDDNTITIFKDDVYENTEGKTGFIGGGQLNLDSGTSTDTQTSSGLMIYELDSDSGLISKPYLETEQITKRGAEVSSSKKVAKGTSGATTSTDRTQGSSTTTPTNQTNTTKPTAKNKEGKTKKKALRPKIIVPRQIVNFKTLLLPDIRPKTVVKLVSKTNSNLTGLYGVLSVKYTGSTFDQKWYCECVGVSTEKID